MTEKRMNEIKKADLVSRLNEVQTALNNSYTNIQVADSAELLDYFAYKIKSDEALHKFLINKIKDL